MVVSTHPSNPEITVTSGPSRAIRITDPPTPTPTSPLATIQAHPEWLITRSMGKIRYRDKAIVSGSFRTTVYTDDGPDEGVEVLVKVEGEYSSTLPEARAEGFGGSGLPFVDFLLRFHHEPVDSRSGLEPWDTEVEARQGRIQTDTTPNNFQTYSSYAEWISQAFVHQYRNMPGMDMFISLALTENKKVEYSLPEWLRFSPSQVDVVATPEQDEDGLHVLQASRLLANGDREAWKFWFDEREFPTRIQFSLTSESTPARNLRDGVLEISDIGECVPRLACTD